MPKKKRKCNSQSLQKNHGKFSKMLSKTYKMAQIVPGTAI